jgi:ubiquitin C-terminal hydrolase
LSNYFLKGDFIKEINTSNPLGAQGMISIAYAKLMKELWLGDQPIVIPINFKGILGRFKKQFATEEQ